MRNLFIYSFLLLSIVCASACKPVRVVSSERLSKQKMRNAKTFAFGELTKKVKVNVVNSKAMETYVRQAIMQEMENRGFSYSETQPDVLLDLEVYYRSLRPREESNYYGNNGFYGSRRYYRYGRYDRGPFDTDGIDKGMLARIKMTVGEARNRQLLWKGTVESKLARNPDKRTEHFNMAVFQLVNEALIAR